MDGWVSGVYMCGWVDMGRCMEYCVCACGWVGGVCVEGWVGRGVYVWVGGWVECVRVSMYMWVSECTVHVCGGSVCRWVGGGLRCVHVCVGGGQNVCICG